MDVRMVVDAGQNSFLVILQPVEEGVVDFDESQHANIIIRRVIIFIESIVRKRSVGSD